MSPALSAPEWLDVAVALGTAVLAVATWRMASATKRMAQGSEAQLDELRRQSAAAETRVAQEAAMLQQTGAPRLRLVRREEGSGGPPTADVDFDSATGEWSARFKNVGAVAATFQEAVFLLHPPPALGFTATPRGPISPDMDVMMRVQVPQDRLPLGKTASVPIRMVYGGPTGERELLTVTVQAKDHGERWLIREVERYKPAG